MRRHLLGPMCLGALALCSCVGEIGEPLPDASMVVPDAGMMPMPGVPAIDQFTCAPAGGTAPLLTTCTVLAHHPDGRSIRCALASSDGRTHFQNVDCTVAASQAVMFGTAGSFTLTLTVLDDRAKSVTQTLQVAVDPPANRPPVISTFSAAPSSGIAPYTTTLTWAVSDPDGDPLTCSIDVGADGTVEYPTVDCAKLTQQHTLSSPGAYDVLLKVKDSKGLQAQKVLNLTAKLAVGDLRISKVEWGQVIVTDTPRLVEGKPALLRIHVLADKPGLTGVTVDAEGFTSASGTSLGKLSLVGPPTPPVSESPTVLTQQWVATVPGAWVEVGFEVRIKVDPLDAVAETDETNNAKVVAPVVGSGNNVLQLTSVPVVYLGITASTPDVQPIMQRTWPVKAIVNQTRAPYTFTGTLVSTDTTGWGQLLMGIAAARSADGSSRNYYGFVKVPYNSGIAGLGYVAQEAATGRDDSDPTAAHELGHNLGRNHAPCGGAAMPDVNFPYAGGKTGSWGYDAVNKMLLNPASFFDQMGYCQPAWTSDYNYNAVQTYLETSPYIPPQGPAMYAPMVLVAGVVRGGVATVRPVHRLFAAPSASSEGAWAVLLHPLGGGEVLRAFTPTRLGDSEDLHFSLLLPDPGPLASVEVLHGLQVVGRLEGKPRPEAFAPQLSRVEPTAVRLTWDASAAPTASVAHFAADGTRTTLGLWLTGGDVLIRTDGLTGGSFEVSLSDGVGGRRRTLADR